MKTSKDKSAFHDYIFFYIAVLLFLSFILISQPFMKIPFDIWEHLMRIVSIYDTGTCFLFWPEDRVSSLFFWHWLWAKIFTLFHISNIFVWARIIHVVQFLISSFSVYFFSKTIYHLLDKDHKDIQCDFLALSSTLLWFLGNGTISIYQQAWINWYSVTYQGLSMPLLWFILALTITLFYEESLTRPKILFYQLLIVTISLLILFIHPTEFIFYCISLMILFVLNWKQSYHYIRNHYLLLMILISSLVVLFSTIKINRLLPVPILLHKVNFHQLIAAIQDVGYWVTHGGGNRFPYAISEIAIFSILCAVLFRIYLFVSRDGIQRKIYDFLLIVSIFFLIIPLNGTLAGVIGIVTHKDIVWRFFFGSAWFIFLPLTISRISRTFFKKNQMVYVFTFNLTLIILFCFLSRFFFYHSFYQNTLSVIQLLDANKVGLQYSKSDLNTLADIVRQQDISIEGKTNIFYIRGDMAPILRTVFRKYVYADRRYLQPKASFYEKSFAKQYHLVDIELPANFPKDEEIFRYFDLEKK
jgi:hypothetical protein